MVWTAGVNGVNQIQANYDYYSTLWSNEFNRWRQGQDWYWTVEVPIEDNLKAIVMSVLPKDPNQLIGPAGFGPAGFVAANQSMPYQINFENAPTATAPCAERPDL